MKVSLQIIYCQFESELAHDANIEVLVVKTGSKAHFFGFLDNLLGVFSSFVEEPGHLTLLESFIAIVIRVGKRLLILLDFFPKKLAQSTIRAVHL